MKRSALAPPISSHTDAPLRAMLYALGAAIVLPAVDAMVKWLVIDYPVVMVAWARMGLGALALAVATAPALGTRLVRPRAWRLQLARGASAVLGTVMVFLGFRALPLAECTAIVFVAPVIANLLSHAWFGERTDGRGWIVAVASFAGVLVIVRPGGDLFRIEALYPLAGAFGLAAFLAITRAVSRHDDPRVTAFFGPLVSFALLSLVMPAYWKTPTRVLDVAIFAAIGVLAAAAQMLQTLAYRDAPTHRVAPFVYSSLVFSIVFGAAVFGDLPDAWTFAGMAIIVGVGAAGAIARR